MTVLFDAEAAAKSGRKCGECTLCCKLLPVRELHKGAGEKCKHQSHARGCKVYQQAGMPLSCQLWSCRWLVQPEETPELSRPDRAHYVIDVMPDFVTARDDLNGRTENVEVVQIWIDPNYPHAHEDKNLRAYLARLGEQGVMALIRFDSEKAITLLPPAMCGGEFAVVDDTTTRAGPSHTLDEVAAALGGAAKVRFVP